MAKKTLIIVFVIFFILIAVGVGIYLITKKSDNKTDLSDNKTSKKDTDNNKNTDITKKDEDKKKKDDEDKKKKEEEDKKKKEEEDKDKKKKEEEDKKKKEEEERNKKKNLARYVRIQRVDGTNIVINLNELVILDKNNKNVALSKNGSTITSVAAWENSRIPAMLIDDDNYSNAATADGSDHWYEIDLGSEIEIKKIIIVNRKDCCSDRAKGLQVQLYKDPSSNTSRTILSKADITTDKPTYAWSLDENGFREDLTLDLPWQCVGDIYTPVRRNINNDVECMSINNKDCLWKNNKTECENLLKKDVVLNFDSFNTTYTYNNTNIKPLECGDMHKRVWGAPGYNVSDHWCTKAKNFI